MVKVFATSGHWTGEAGANLVTLAAMLGRSRIQMVLRYAHLTESISSRR